MSQVTIRNVTLEEGAKVNRGDTGTYLQREDVVEYLLDLASKNDGEASQRLMFAARQILKVGKPK